MKVNDNYLLLISGFRFLLHDSDLFFGLCDESLSDLEFRGVDLELSRVSLHDLHRVLQILQIPLDGPKGVSQFCGAPVRGRVVHGRGRDHLALRDGTKVGVQVARLGQGF